MHHSRRVVVTGLGLVTCLGSGVQNNWTSLLKNECGIRKLTGEDCVGPCHIAGTLPPGVLEEAVSRIMEQQASLRGLERQLDRQAMSRTSLLAIVAAHEALQQSGWLPAPNQTSPRNFATEDQASCRAGTYFSAGLEGVEEIVKSLCLTQKKGYRGMGAHVLPRTLSNMPVGHISRAWGLRGPTMSANTACASGLHSVGEAYRMIQYGEADMVVAGGCEASVLPWTLAAFSRIRALALDYNDQPKLASRPFDSQRQGFVMSEGAGALVLEAWPTPLHLLDALHRRTLDHQPLAEIVGFGRSADAYNLVSPEPTGSGAFRSMKAALDDARLHDLNQVEHINCHATSTPLGDVIELAAIAKLLEHYPRSASAPRIAINSIKGHIGHCLGAAGAVEAVYSVLAAKHARAAPNRNLEQAVTPEEVCKLGHKVGRREADNQAELLFTRTFMPTQSRVAMDSRSNTRLMVLTNSFGFGGANASILLSNWVD
ncbi:unnamed protein product [Schistocephalus solidus]|uniref:beta-ketoacyl-[acyl-carrier-protein] synthase I n=1 Tax=Schistocephalus solidus TaxID=70667 RepID=A0A183SDI7_SCHSO|nr:unnamed protein product [Schistocephalus solidus]